MKIGILGQGYVGSAIKIGFEKHYKDINTFDKYNKSRSTVSNLEELTENIRKYVNENYDKSDFHLLSLESIKYATKK